MSHSFLDGELEEEVYRYKTAWRICLLACSTSSASWRRGFTISRVSTLLKYCFSQPSLEDGFHPTSHWSMRIQIFNRRDRQSTWVYTGMISLSLIKVTRSYVVKAKKEFASRFYIKDMGKLHQFLSMVFVQEAISSVWRQPVYNKSILLKFGMENAKINPTPVDPSNKLVKATEVY